MFKFEISWGQHREYKCDVAAFTNFDVMINGLELALYANIDTYNLSAIVWEDDKTIYDGPLNTMIINGLRYISQKRKEESGGKSA